MHAKTKTISIGPTRFFLQSILQRHCKFLQLGANFCKLLRSLYKLVQVLATCWSVFANGTSIWRSYADLSLLIWSIRLRCMYQWNWTGIHNLMKGPNCNHNTCKPRMRGWICRASSASKAVTSSPSCLYIVDKTAKIITVLTVTIKTRR